MAFVYRSTTISKVCIHAVEGLKHCCRFLSTAENKSTLPLSGIRVLDFTRILAGPFCTMLLGDLGAEVIKVERLVTGDDTRTWGPPFANSESTYFLSINRNKKSVALDIKSDGGKEIIRQLASTSDVLVENFVPGTLDRQGLGYEDLSAVNKKLIFCSITGFGSTGPYASRAGYDVIASGVGGLMHITGSKDGEPVKTGVALTDLSTGLYAHSAILAALLQRRQTHQGQWIQCNLLSTQVSLLTHIASNYLNSNVEATRIGSAHASIVPYQAFETSDGWLVVGAGNDKLFANLCKSIGHAQLSSDERFCSNHCRVNNRKILVELLSEIFRPEPTSHWLQVLEGSGIAYGPINDLPQVFSDPQVRHMEAVQTVQHRAAGEIKLLSPAVKYSGFCSGKMTAPPVLGEHTVSVLRDILNYGPEQIEELKDSGCISELKH
ncbi:succinate--hydroxymethylglutarate CoA-transferase-like isoform X2 [Halichondria panicea]|uniref:succinate--hydroxymethylglutarate CoA-transferase-like isoform X2 n=1 Tax=Halichondria panicea TaxID=6063 RepID=UPI00312B6C4D